MLLIFAVSACARNVTDDPIVLANTLESAHPDLFFHATKTSFDRAIERAELKLSRRSSASDAFRVLEPIVSSIGDAHTYIDPFTDDYLNYRSAKGLLFPLEFRAENGQAFVTASFGFPNSVPIGSSIESINGRPLTKILASLRKYESGENDALRDWGTSQDARELFWLTGIRAPFRVDLRIAGRDLRKTLPGCTIDDVRAWDKTPAGMLQAQPFSLDVYEKRSVAVLTVHSFDRDDASDWHAFLASTAERLKRERPRSLIIDIRQNTGGDTEMSDELLAMFAARPYRDFSEYIEKISNVTKKALGHDAYVETYGDEAWQLPDGSIRTLDTDYEQPEPTDRRYNGTVYMLIGTGTFSTAAIFAAAVQDSKNALVWGAESGGCATLYGELFSFRLPHSNLSVSVSTKHFIRSGGSHAGGGHPRSCIQ